MMGLIRTFLSGSCLIGAVVLGGPVAAQALDGVGLIDAETVLQQSQPRTFDVSMREDTARRFAPDQSGPEAEAGDTRQFELEFAAAGDRAGLPVDVSVAQRATLRSNRDGEIDGSGGGSEVRIGRGLVRQDDGAPSDNPSVYFFVADDDEALTWSPGQRTGLDGRGGLAMQEDRVEVGDSAAGITYERNGIQASLAYVERSVSTQVGNQYFSNDESFTGVTVTMRH